jgi:hypothetical protein
MGPLHDFNITSLTKIVFGVDVRSHVLFDGEMGNLQVIFFRVIFPPDHTLSAHLQRTSPSVTRVRSLPTEM